MTAEGFVLLDEVWVRPSQVAAVRQVSNGPSQPFTSLVFMAGADTGFDVAMHPQDVLSLLVEVTR